MNDERQGLPSASHLQRLAACPGSQALIASGPPGGYSTPESEAGTRMHRAFANIEAISDLSADEADVVTRASLIASHYLEQWKHDFGIKEIGESMQEQRLWLFKTGAPVFSGQFDAAWIAGKRGLVLDLKSMWGSHPEPAENLQLAAYAVLLAHRYSLDHVRTGIVQPHSEPTAPADYDTADLANAEEEIIGIIDFAKMADARRIPGPQCRYCPAAPRCPEARGEITNLATVAMTISDTVGVLPAEKLADLLDKCEIVGPLITRIRDEALKRIKENPDAIPGWTLGKPRKLRQINNIIRAWQICAKLGMSQGDFLSCAKLSLPMLVRAYGMVNGISAARAKAELLDRLGDAVSESETAPGLRRI